MSTQFISMDALHEKLGQLGADELILDVRTPEEFQSGHVPGSKNIDHRQVGSHADELRRYKKIFIYCQAGMRAQFAASMLERLGLTSLVCIADSGMGDWHAAGYPVE